MTTKKLASIQRGLERALDTAKEETVDSWVAMAGGDKTFDEPKDVTCDSCDASLGQARELREAYRVFLNHYTDRHEYNLPSPELQEELDEIANEPDRDDW